MRTRSIALAGVAAAVVAAGAVPAHAQVKAGPEFRASTYTTGAQRNASLSIQSNGDFVITWRSAAQDGAGEGMFGQRYNRNGSTKGGEFQINTVTAADQRLGHVSVNKKGQFIVVYESTDGAYPRILAQRFDASGTKVGAEFQVSTNTDYGQYYPNAALDNRGNFVVVWSDGGGDGPGNYGVRAKRYDSGGNQVGAEFSVNTTTGYYQGLAKVAFQPSGGFIVVWSNQAGSAGDADFEVDGRRYDANGVALGGEFRVNTTTLGYQYFSGVGVAADGSFIVDWQSVESDPPAPSREIRAQRMSASGAKVGAEFLVNTYSTGGQYSYQVGVDGQGNYVVAWDDPGRDGSSFAPFGWRISSADTRRGAEFEANTYTTGYQGITQVASDEVGNFIVAWHSDQDADGSRGVYAQRFGGLFPAALSVDAANNRVWEPGETVAVQPSWQNQNGASQTFAATLGPLTGPAGATYTIVDGVGDYGTVANGATQQCTNCYSVMVDNPASRPVTHWDATAVEKITPDTLGEQKGWSLHIGNSFTDVINTSPFYRFIETLLHNGVTGGCTATTYCPSQATTREQMAAFVLAAKEGAGFTPPACSPPNTFTDVPETSPFCRFIEELAARGVVGGCSTNPPQYCPTQAVTREQMSIFVLRTLDPNLNPPACGTPVFNDVPASSPFCKWIEELVRRGIVTGCSTNPPQYCPTQSVTREQMGVFISGTFGLVLYGI